MRLGYRLLNNREAATREKTFYRGLYRVTPTHMHDISKLPSGPLGEALSLYLRLVESEDELIPAVDVAKQVVTALGSAGEEYEIVVCDLIVAADTESRIDDKGAELLGYDVAWLGGSFYSIVFDGLIHRSYGAEEYEKLLNRYGLFENVDNARKYRNFYMSLPISKREDGEFFLWGIWALPA
jgi:hypothetical protein